MMTPAVDQPPDSAEDKQMELCLSRWRSNPSLGWGATSAGLENHLATRHRQFRKVVPIRRLILMAGSKICLLTCVSLRLDQASSVWTAQ